jgi:aminobenzoyl-glutamate utilization protein B
VAAPRWGAEARAVAREIQANAGIEPMAEPFLPACERLIDPREAEAILRRDLPPSQLNSPPDDYTEMTWHAPTARFYVARPALKSPPGFAYPPWVMNALGGIPATIDPTATTAAKILALSALRLLEDPDARRAAMDEFTERTGGGVRGSAWIPPLCDYAPPIHFRWPEYVTTARGHDWWIPSETRAPETRP